MATPPHNSGVNEVQPLIGEGMVMAIQKPKILAEDITRDIRSGLNFGELMEKYRVTERQLDRVIRRLVNLGMIRESETSSVGKPTRKLSATNIVKDLRSGMSDQDLKAKYSITDQQMEKILGKIVDAGMMSEMELFERSTLSASTVTKCFVETQQSIRDLGLASVDGRVQESGLDDAVEITEVHSLPGSFLDDMLSRLKG
jgi:uncharacterized protein (DUF433 family)